MNVTAFHIGKYDSQTDVRNGYLVFDVVNVGQEVVFLKQISLQSCAGEEISAGQWFIYPTKWPNTDSVRLEPGASHSFWQKDWDFNKNPIDKPSTKYCVAINSTKGLLVFERIHISSIMYAEPPDKSHEKKSSAKDSHGTH